MNINEYKDDEKLRNSRAPTNQRGGSRRGGAGGRIFEYIPKALGTGEGDLFIKEVDLMIYSLRFPENSLPYLFVLVHYFW